MSLLQTLTKRMNGSDPGHLHGNNINIDDSSLQSMTNIDKEPSLPGCQIHADDIGIKRTGSYSGYLTWLSNNPTTYAKVKSSTAGRKRSLDGLPFYDNETPSYAIFSRCLSLDDKPEDRSTELVTSGLNDFVHENEIEDIYSLDYETGDSDLASQNETVYVHDPGEVTLDSKDTDSSSPVILHAHSNIPENDHSSACKPRTVDKGVQVPEGAAALAAWVPSPLYPDPSNYWEQMEKVEDGIFHGIGSQHYWMSGNRACEVIEQWDAGSHYELSLAPGEVVDLSFLASAHIRGEWWFGVLCGTAGSCRRLWALPDDLPELRRRAGFFPARCARLLGGHAADGSGHSHHRSAVAATCLTAEPLPIHEVFRDGPACDIAGRRRRSHIAGEISPASMPVRLGKECSGPLSQTLPGSAGFGWDGDDRAGCRTSKFISGSAGRGDQRAGNPATSWPAGFAPAVVEDWMSASATSSWDNAETVSESSSELL